MNILCRGICLTVLLVSICVCRFAIAQNAPQDAPSGDLATVAEQYLLSAANQERVSRGLAPLHRDPQLVHAAAAHAQQMATRSAISHQFEGEPELTARAQSAGVHFSVVSENVGEGPAAVEIEDKWMHSEEHRTNLLDPAIDAAGISVVARGGQLFAVEDFARTVQSLSLEAQESAIAGLIAKPGAIAIDTSQSAVSAARQTCTMQTGFAGSKRPGFVMRFSSDTTGLLPDQLKERIATGQYHHAVVGACAPAAKGPYASYAIAVMLFQ